MSVHIDELNPETRARMLARISGTEGGTTALATLEKETFTTLGDPATFTDDQLADIVIDGVKKLRQLLPYIIAMKARFDAGDRDRTNRLKTPIKGCYSWKEFCKNRLDRAPQTIGEALTPVLAPAVEIPAPKPVACACPDCAQPFPSRGQLKRHGQSNHNISTVEIADFLRRADDTAYSQQKSEYDSLLDSISKRILGRDGADQDYSHDEDEPLEWRSRNTVRVRITTIIHNMVDRRTFWFELSSLLWSHGWRGNTIFREGRREAWIFHWTTGWVGNSEIPADWGPETDCAPVEPQPIIDAEFVDASQPIENSDADIEAAVLALPDSPELDEAAKNPIQHKAINNQPTKPDAKTESFLKQTQRVWKSVTNPSVGRITVTASNVGSDVETAAGRYDLMLYGVTPQLLNKIRELLSCK
jgi:hypothetical protein